MDTFWILLEQIGLFVIYIIIGVALVKTKVLNQETVEVIASFVLKLGLPVMIFINTVNGVDRQTLIRSLPILVLAVIFYCCTFVLGKVLASLFRLKGNQGQVYRVMAMFGNIGFMGIPIISSIYPEHGILYISVFTIIDQLVLWTIGVKLTTPVGKGKFQIKKLVNPCTVAIVLAVFLILTGIPLPLLLGTALEKVGNTATPLAMIYLGGVFACMDIREYLYKKEFYGIVAGKMLLFPILFYLFSGLFPITQEIHLTISLLAGMPAMSSVVMMTKASGSEGDYAMGGIFVTTVCSIVSLPLICWILQSIA